MKRLFVFAVALLLCSGDAFAATCNPPPTCGDNQASKWTGSGWTCVNLGAGTLDVKIVTAESNPSSPYYHSNNIIASCPAGYSLLACSGADGGNVGYQEGGGWRVTPDTANNRCIGTLSAPIGVSNGNFHPYVHASCYR